MKNGRLRFLPGDYVIYGRSLNKTHDLKHKPCSKQCVWNQARKLYAPNFKLLKFSKKTNFDPRQPWTRFEIVYEFLRIASAPKCFVHIASAKMFCTYSERQNVCTYMRQHVQYPRERNIEDFMRAHFRRVACARQNLYTIKRRALAKTAKSPRV